MEIVLMSIWAMFMNKESSCCDKFCLTEYMYIVVQRLKLGAYYYK